MDESEDSEQDQAVLFSACIDRMKISLIRPDFCHLGLETCKPGDDKVDDTDEKVAYRIPADLSYACLHWGHHFKRCVLEAEQKKQPERITHLEDTVLAFMRHHYLFWIEALSLLRRVDEGYSMIKELAALPVSLFVLPRKMFCLAISNQFY